MDSFSPDHTIEPALLPHPPVDKVNWALYYHCIMIGVGALLSWNAVSTAFDWINTEFNGMQASLVFTLIDFIPNLVFIPLTVAYGYKFLFNTRIILPFFAMGGMLAVIPPIVLYTNSVAGYSIMCVLVFILGAFNTIADNSIYSLTATLPGRYIGAAMIGNGVAGLLINVVRMICLTVLPHDLTLSTVIYFIVSGATLILCMISQWCIMKNPFVRECVAKTSCKVKPDLALAPSEKQLMSADRDETDTGTTKVRPPKFLEVLREIWQYSFLVFMCYLVTFGMFPTACISTEGK